MKNTSALILAAGLSTRMGEEKFALEYSPGLTFLEHIAAQYHQSDCHRIVVVLNPTGKKLLDKLQLRLPETVQVVINHNPERGRFSSLKKGLKSLKNQDFIFLHNIDNPYITKYIINSLLKNTGSADYACPAFMEKGGHPVLLRSNVVKAILAEKGDDINLSEFLKGFKKKLINTNNPAVLLNINTSEDYKNWKISG